jgi:hypothetical protein
LKCTYDKKLQTSTCFVSRENLQNRQCIKYLFSPLYILYSTPSTAPWLCRTPLHIHIFICTYSIHPFTFVRICLYKVVVVNLLDYLFDITVYVTVVVGRRARCNTQNRKQLPTNRLPKYGSQSETTIDSCLGLGTIPGQTHRNTTHRTKHRMKNIECPPQLTP